MTTYDEMPAGQEIDALVAEKVFGFQRWRGVPGAFHPTGIHWWQTEKPCNPPSYSTDIAAAWKVMEKLNMQCGYSTIDGKPFAMYQMKATYADTVPLAICRSALRVVLGD